MRYDPCKQCGGSMCTRGDVVCCIECGIPFEEVPDLAAPGQGRPRSQAELIEEARQAAPVSSPIPEPPRRRARPIE